MTLEILKQAAHLRGYVVLNYSEALYPLIVLGVYDRAQKSKAVAVSIDNNNFIFIDDSLSEEKQTFALAHELGHIVLNHQPSDTIRKSKLQEIEADRFAMIVTGLNTECLFKEMVVA